MIWVKMKNELSCYKTVAWWRVLRFYKIFLKNIISKNSDVKIAAGINKWMAMLKNTPYSGLVTRGVPHHYYHQQIFSENLVCPSHWVEREVSR